MAILTDEGKELIKRSEGLVLKVYPDAGGKSTIGWGHLLRPGEHYEEITESMAQDLFDHDVGNIENVVQEFLEVDLNDNQYSALVCLVFNLGVAPLHGTLGKLINDGAFSAAADQFSRWVYSDNGRGEKVILQGLVTRRAAERALFLKPV